MLATFFPNERQLSEIFQSLLYYLHDQVTCNFPAVDLLQMAKWTNYQCCLIYYQYYLTKSLHNGLTISSILLRIHTLTFLGFKPPVCFSKYWLRSVCCKGQGHILFSVQPSAHTKCWRQAKGLTARTHHIFKDKSECILGMNDIM